MDENKTRITICRRCGRKLKTDEAIERGMGRTCWEKSQTSEVKKPLFDKEMIHHAEGNTRV